MSREITTNQGHVFIVDDSDYEELSKFRWTSLKASRKDFFYANAYKDRKTQSMHRIIMNAPKGLEVDHMDGNTQNNQRSNLRICTHTENQRNSKKRINSASIYKGLYKISWKRKSGEVMVRWQVRMSKFNYAKTFVDELEAAKHYNEKAKEFHGEFARLNDLEV